MTVYDTVIYQDKTCVVEQTWEAEDADHTAYCAIRPLAHEGEYSGEVSGTFYVEQSATRPA